MTEPIAATPGWVDSRLSTIFASLPAEAQSACDAFAECLAVSKSPAAPSDMLGAEFEPCHAAFKQTLRGLDTDAGVLAQVTRDLEALEAEIAADS